MAADKQAFFRDLFRAGYSANEAQRAAVGTQYATRRTTILAWYREERPPSIVKGYDINRIPMNKRPSRERLPVARHIIRGGKHATQFTVQYDVLDLDGRRSTYDSRVRFSRPVLPTRREILEMAERGIDKVVNAYNLTVTDTRIIRGLKQVPL